MLLAIDPGSRAAGLALFDKGVLIHARVVTAAGWLPMGAAFRDAVQQKTGFVSTLVMEWPHDQKREGVRVDNLITLAAAAGATAGQIAAVFDPGFFRFIQPADWKGSVPKPKTVAAPYIITQRINRALTPAEKDAIRAPKSVKQSYDVYDAIGIGLWHLKRLRRGMV